MARAALVGRRPSTSGMTLSVSICFASLHDPFLGPVPSLAPPRPSEAGVEPEAREGTVRGVGVLVAPRLSLFDILVLPDIDGQVV